MVLRYVSVVQAPQEEQVPVASAARAIRVAAGAAAAGAAAAGAATRTAAGALAVSAVRRRRTAQNHHLSRRATQNHHVSQPQRPIGRNSTPPSPNISRRGSPSLLVVLPSLIKRAT